VQTSVLSTLEVSKHHRRFSECDQAIKIDPKKYAAAYYCRGIAHRANEEYNKAIEDHTEAIKIDPKYSDAYNSLGVARRCKSNCIYTPDVIKDFEKAFELDPQNNIAYDNCLRAYHAKDNDLTMPLVKIRKNQEYMEEMQGNIKKVVPFLGAGASKPYGYCLWSGLLQKLLDMCCQYHATEVDDKKNNKKEIIQGHLNTKSYVKAADVMDEIFPSIGSMVSTMIERTAEANPFETTIKQSTLSEYLHLFPNQTIVTTNYDTVIQDILKRQKQQFEIICPTSGEKEKQNTTRFSGAKMYHSETLHTVKTIYHLHGIWTDTVSVTLSSLHYDDYYGEEGKIKSNLRKKLPWGIYEIYHNSIFLYMGCGMDVDKDRILKVLREFYRSLPKAPPSYALLNMNEVEIPKILVEKWEDLEEEDQQKLKEELIAACTTLYEDWQKFDERVQNVLNAALDEKEKELRNMNVRVIWYSANSDDKHESAKRQLFKFILANQPRRVREEKAQESLLRELKKQKEAQKNAKEKNKIEKRQRSAYVEFEKKYCRENVDDPETAATENDTGKYLRDKILTKQVTPEKCVIALPMHKTDGGLYEIYLVSENGGFYLSDEGATHAELDEIFELTEPDVKKNIAAILKQYGCRVQPETNACIIDCTLEDIHVKMSYLIQAISFMLNMKIFYI